MHTNRPAMQGVGAVANENTVLAAAAPPGYNRYGSISLVIDLPHRGKEIHGES